MNVSSTAKEKKINEIRQLIENYRLYGDAEQIQIKPGFRRGNRNRKTNKLSSFAPGRRDRRLGTRAFPSGDTTEESKNSKKTLQVNRNMTKEWEEAAKVFKTMKRQPKIEPSSQFKEYFEEVDDILERPKPQQYKFLEIRDKNGFEKLEYHNEGSTWGKITKKILLLSR